MKVNRELLEKTRIYKGFTKFLLAEKAGISDSTIFLVLNGTNSHPPTIKAVSEALDLTPEEVWLDEESKI